jgi:hypothetical protein
VGGPLKYFGTKIVSATRLAATVERI